MFDIAHATVNSIETSESKNNYIFINQYWTRYNIAVSLPICFTRIIAHLRTVSKFIINIISRNIKNTIDPSVECALCHKNELVDLFHVLVSCSVYLVLSKQFIPDFLNLNKNNYYTLLYNPKYDKFISIIVY